MEINGVSYDIWSLSARRAWIEIISGLQPLIASLTVALRKESVDRNNPPVKPFKIGEKSLSARRAWIEIGAGHTGQ